MGNFFHDVGQNLALKNIPASLTRSQSNLYTLGLADRAHIEPGDNQDQLFGGAKRLATQNARDSEAAGVKQQQENEGRLIDQTNSLFGVGQTPDAIANRQTIANTGDRLGQGTLESGLSSADQQYSQGLTSGRAQLARAGLIGSPVQGQLMADLGTQRTASVLGAQTAAQQARQRLTNQNMNQRLGLISNIRGGQVTDTTGLNTTIAGLNGQSGGGSIAGNVVGSFLPQAANAYSNQAQTAALKG